MPTIHGEQGKVNKVPVAWGYTGTFAVEKQLDRFSACPVVGNRITGSYLMITQSLPLRPKTSGEYISSALAGGTMNVPGVVARAI